MKLLFTLITTTLFCALLMSTTIVACYPRLDCWKKTDNTWAGCNTYNKYGFSCLLERNPVACMPPQAGNCGADLSNYKSLQIWCGEVFPKKCLCKNGNCPCKATAKEVNSCL